MKNRSKSFSSKQTSLMAESRLSWNTHWKAHTVSTFGGFRYLSDSYLSDGIIADNSVGDKLPDITSSMDNRKVNGVVENWKSVAVYLNADWNYADKYAVQGTFASETSSRFGRNAGNGVSVGNNVWGIFPSLQAAWVLSAEPFFRAIHCVDFLKFNVGIDRSGNDDIDCFASQSYFSSSPFLNQTAGLALANIGNDQLKWETTTRLTAGFEMAMLKNRLSIGLHCFYSSTDDLLTWKTLDGLSGLTDYLCNEGSLSNHGFNLWTKVKVLAMENLSWELGGSLSKYQNCITSLPDGDKETIHSAYEAEILTRVGSPAGLFYGYRTEGVFSTSEEALKANLCNGSLGGNHFGAGDVHFVDVVSDGVIDSQDKMVIGNPNPELYGMFYSEWHYKRWALNAIFSYSVGNDIYNCQRSRMESMNGPYNQTVSVCNRWTNEGQLTSIPRASWNDPMGNSRFSDRWIEDGSYLKLKSLRVDYRLPINNTYLQGITLWGNVDNVFTASRYLGNNPEVSVSTSPLYQGIDAGLLSEGRRFVVGVKMNL